MSLVVDRVDVGRLLAVEPNGAAPAAELLDLVAGTGALLRGHFGLQSGNHAPHFVRFAQIGRDRAAIAKVARWLRDASRFSLDADCTVLVPESAGFALGHAVAAEIGASLATVRIDLRRRPLGLPLRAGGLVEGRPVVVVNDVATTAGSLDHLVDLATRAGCVVRGVVLFGMIDGDAVKAMLAARGLAAAWLVTATWRAVPAARCGACERGEPLLVASEFN